MSALEWKDISMEEWRRYTFPNGDEVLIEAPLKLNVSASGGHRVASADGNGHYIPKGWLHLEWKNKPGVTEAVSF